MPQSAPAIRFSRVLPAPRLRAAACAFLLCALGPPAAAQGPTGGLTGQVIEQATGAAVDGATVRLGETLEAETDEHGMFHLTGVPAGRHTLRVSRLGFGERSIEIAVEAGRTSRIRLTITEQAITLAPLNVEAVSNEQLRARGAGYTRGIVTRADIAQWEGTNMKLADVLRQALPSVRVRRQERIAGSDVCIELRSIRGATNTCLTPAVYLDGVPIGNPTMLFATLDIRAIERMEVVPAAEAGVRYGTGALYGALLIETRRPGADRPDAPRLERRSFDWSLDQERHPMVRAFVSSAVGNGAGVALGVAAAGECIYLRRPAYDAIKSDCDVLPTIGVGLAAIVLPALGSGLGTRLGGQTRASRGRFVPAVIGTAMVVLPGYALALAGKRNDSAAQQWIGRGVIIIGAPLAATAADYLFRRIRE